MKIEIRSTLDSIEPAAWDELVGAGSPFLEWNWLTSLEESGCVTPENGWLPQHLTLWDGERLIGACPLYVKGHSQGEFVFDHGWADAAMRAGISYYPKLLVAVPFTPATGARLLAHPRNDRRAVVRSLGDALKRICTDQGFSSVHVNFCLPDEVEILGNLGFERRTAFQFQWTNPGWRTFDDYLAAFRSKRRIQIKREQRELKTQDVEISIHAGDAIPDDLFPVMFRLYRSTIDKLYWGRQYLNLELFELLRRRWKHRLCFILARRRGEVIAGALGVQKNDVLYGRYWGAFTPLRHLHFNVCYYAPIEYCLAAGISRFEPGAGGEFKHLRGFDARPTDSMHFVAEPRLARAIRQYLAAERRSIAQDFSWLEQHSALKK